MGGIEAAAWLILLVVALPVGGFSIALLAAELREREEDHG